MSGTQGGTAYGLDTQRGDDWRHAAVCRDEDPESFYPVGNGGPALDQTERAKAVCRRCPVVLACLMDALQYPAQDQHGVQAGLTAEERQAFIYPCPRWHERTAENLAVSGGVPYCVPCRRAGAAEFFAGRREPITAEFERAAA